MAKRRTTEVVAGLAVLAAAAGFLAFGVSSTGLGRVSGLKLAAQFGNIGSLAPGADVRVAGVPVGRVTGVSVDPKTYQALVRFTVQPDLQMPTDSSAQITTGGLLGGAFLTLSPGGDDAMLKDGSVMTITQSATNLEDLLGKFIFNVGSLADATQKSLDQKAAPAAAKP